MVRKFKDKEDLWFDYLQFLVHNKCTKTLNVDAAACLSNFPTNVLFWKIAAYNEFENNNDALSARALFQKCLRLNKKKIEAVVDYFVFEIKFAEKLQNRRRMLSKSSKLEMIEESKEEITLQDSDEILMLKIPELIWDSEKNNFNMSELGKRFLEALFKYSNELPGSRLIKSIANEINCNEEELGLIKAKAVGSVDV